MFCSKLHKNEYLWRDHLCTSHKKHRRLFRLWFQAPWQDHLFQMQCFCPSVSHFDQHQLWVELCHWLHVPPQWSEALILVVDSLPVAQAPHFWKDLGGNAHPIPLAASGKDMMVRGILRGILTGGRLRGRERKDPHQVRHLPKKHVINLKAPSETDVAA